MFTRDMLELVELEFSGFQKGKDTIKMKSLFASCPLTPYFQRKSLVAQNEYHKPLDWMVFSNYTTLFLQTLITLSSEKKMKFT